MSRVPAGISNTLADVRYEIRGQLAHRAADLEKQGCEIISLDIGNPGLFGFRTPETMRLAMIEILGLARHYNCPPDNAFLPGRDAILDVFSRIDSMLRQTG